MPGDQAVFDQRSSLFAPLCSFDRFDVDRHVFMIGKTKVVELDGAPVDPLRSFLAVPGSECAEPRWAGSGCSTPAKEMGR